LLIQIDLPKENTVTQINSDITGNKSTSLKDNILGNSLYEGANVSRNCEKIGNKLHFMKNFPYNSRNTRNLKGSITTYWYCKNKNIDGKKKIL